MPLLSALLMTLVAAGPTEKAAIVVSLPDSPVRLEHAVVLTPSEGPPVVLYGAANGTGDELEQFTVIAFVFDADGTVKARQTAPGRRTLEAKATKYSTLVLDGSAVGPTDVIVVGVNGVQRAGSDTWWHGDLQAAAVAAARPKK